MGAGDSCDVRWRYILLQVRVRVDNQSNSETSNIDDNSRVLIVRRRNEKKSTMVKSSTSIQPVFLCRILEVTFFFLIFVNKMVPFSRQLRALARTYARVRGRTYVGGMLVRRDVCLPHLLTRPRNNARDSNDRSHVILDTRPSLVFFLQVKKAEKGLGTRLGRQCTC